MWAEQCQLHSWHFVFLWSKVTPSRYPIPHRLNQDVGCPSRWLQNLNIVMILRSPRFVQYQAVHDNIISMITLTIYDGAFSCYSYENLDSKKQCLIKYSRICSRYWTYLLLKTVVFCYFSAKCDYNISKNDWEEHYCLFTKWNNIRKVQRD